MSDAATPTMPGGPQAGLSAPAGGSRLPQPFLHEGFGQEHFHDMTDEEKEAVDDFIWTLDNVELTTVGIDIGSSTSHLMFAKVHLQRKAQMLSSAYVVVNRTVLWKSPILLTPFLPDNTIDAGKLKAFIDDAYREAGLARDAVDSGAVILTGEAIKRSNARAIAELFADETGKFVCASAGHHLECTLASHGSGSVALSRRTHRTVLNVDIGGGTTKFGLIEKGVLRATYAVAVGGRLLVRDAGGVVTRMEDSARMAAEHLGLPLRLGQPAGDADVARISDLLSEVVIDFMRGAPPSAFAQSLMLTELPAAFARPHWITFSGGVSEYLFGREPQTFGDIARPLADRITAAFVQDRIPAAMIDPGHGIRATVIGASQFTVQVSGKTIHISPRAELPLHNVPVVFPALPKDGDFDPGLVRTEVLGALQRMDLDAGQTIAIAIAWHGDPHYQRLRNLVDGLAAALGAGSELPVVLMVDGDVARTLGMILEEEVGVARPVIAIDGVQLQELDYVDIGKMVMPAAVVPVVIKSLLFSAGR
ncbi:ethanolamine ammonia-lyase reactivating factor EutA [Pigmentiphaga soli]|uniref:Ethanolamine ammonia-lyase reactivating factor EutA n=1 Tax=Pigmentiphaga soli TaxID=1007095 RepID=A0ABP8HAN5_9BURK